MKRSVAAVLLPLALASCAPSMMAPNAGTIDGLYLQSVTGSNLFEIQSSQVALQKSQNQGVRAYAQQMIDMHTPAQQQVAALAAARKVPLPAALPPELQLKVNTLAATDAAAFDAAYIKEQILSHQFTVSIFQNQQAAGKDAEVVAWANANLPMIQAHLQQAQALGGAAPAGHSADH